MGQLFPKKEYFLKKNGDATSEMYTVTYSASSISPKLPKSRTVEYLRLQSIN